MPFRIVDLLDVPDLRLSVVAARDRLDRPIEAAHVSELLRPGAWLQGGELLMTIGLLLPVDRSGCRAYVHDVDAGGASCLVLGLGHELPYQEAPAPLVEAAQEAGLPLLTVPHEVPFIAITKAVFAARAAEQRLALERAYEAQRRLTAAAASGRGLTAILEAWAQATGVGAAVTDPLGRIIASVGRGTEAALEASGDLIQRVAVRGLLGSGTSIVHSAHVEVQPLGAQRLRGLLMLTGEMDPATRLLASGLVSLLSLELERRHLADEPGRRRRSALLGRLLTEGTTAEQVRDLLAAAGLVTDAVRGIAIEPTADADDVVADLALAVPGGLARVTGGVVEAVVGGDLDVLEALNRFAPGFPTGIGPSVPPESAASSLRQARGLLGISRIAGRPVEAQANRSGQLLLELGNRFVLSGYADAVLGALDDADPSGDLVATLATWLDTAGSWDETSRRLGVHRHTVRNRLDKVMRVTGRRLDDGDDRFDLWLAIRGRQAAQHTPTSPGAAPQQPMPPT
ncbi:PucR family transcriptional regulator [Streptomyces sp. NPDC001970]